MKTKTKGEELRSGKNNLLVRIRAEGELFRKLADQRTELVTQYGSEEEYFNIMYGIHIGVGMCKQKKTPIKNIEDKAKSEIKKSRVRLKSIAVKITKLDALLKQKD